MVEGEGMRVVDEGVGELLQLGQAEARGLGIMSAAILPLRVDSLIEGEVGVARLGDVCQLHGGGEVRGDGARGHGRLLLLLLAVQAVLSVLIVLADLIVLQAVIVMVAVLVVLTELIVRGVLIVLAVLIVWRAVPAVRAVLTVLAALGVLAVLGVLGVAGRPLYHHAALRRLDTAVRRRAQAVLLNHSTAVGVNGGHLLAHGAAALGQAAGGDSAIRAAVLGGAGTTNASPHGGVVAAGIFVVLRGAFDAT